MKKQIIIALMTLGIAHTLPFISHNAIAAPQIKNENAWNTNYAKSNISWQTNWAGNNIIGNFSNFNANIIFNPNNLEGTNILINIPINSLKSPSKDAMSNLFLEDWFNLKKYPIAQFSSNIVKKTGANTYIASGFLNIKGVKYKIDLPFTLNINGNNASMSANTTLDRINLKLGIESDSNAEWVSRKVNLKINLVATK